MSAREEAPRTLLSNGTILVLDGETPAQEAMVHENGRIVGVGTRDEMKKLAGAKAAHLDLRGATVMPGLVNGHPHMLHFGALTAPLVDLFDARDHDDIVERIRVRAESTPAGEWILCTPVGEPHYFIRRSYADLPEQRLPDRKVLDRATRAHPVLIQAWAPKTPNACAFNSMGLARMGIARITPSQVCDVTIEKDDDGFPTGILRGPVNNYYTDDPFWLQILGRLPQPNDMLWEIGAWEGMKLMNRLGVTAGYEAHVMDLAHIRAFQKVRDQGGMTCRVSCALELSNGAFNAYSDPSRADIVAQCELGRSIKDLADDWVRVEGVTLVRGGPCWPGYLRMNEPYKDPLGRPTRGKTFLPREYEELVIDWCGTHGVRMNMVLGGHRDHDDFFESLAPYVAKHGIAKRKWVAQHSILISPDHIRRYAELGFDMTTSVGFAWGKGDIYAERMGRGVWPDLIPLGRMVDAGLNVSCGTDWGPLSIFEQMWLAETHEFCGSGHRNLTPGHAVTREQSLLTWTRNGARLMQWDGIGSLKAGFHADFIVVDRDPATCALDDLRATKVLRTVVGGKTVYEGERV
ncbi:MAG: amidohydrolase [Candidatus Binatia bacterium]